MEKYKMDVRRFQVLAKANLVRDNTGMVCQSKAMRGLIPSTINNGQGIMRTLQAYAVELNV